MGFCYPSCSEETSAALNGPLGEGRCLCPPSNPPPRTCFDRRTASPPIPVMRRKPATGGALVLGTFVESGLLLLRAGERTIRVWLPT